MRDGLLRSDVVVTGWDRENDDDKGWTLGTSDLQRCSKSESVAGVWML